MSAASSTAAPPPAWSASFVTATADLVIATYGAQARDVGDLGPFRSWCERVTIASHAPDVCEAARFIDAAGWHNEVRILYWRDAKAFADWSSSAIVTEWWEHPDRLAAPFGVWREVITVPANRLETILSAPSIAIGSGRLSDKVDGPIEKHGYWGSMRDRLPISATDPLASSWAGPLISRSPGGASGRRLRVDAPTNLALIRSGQDTSKCPPDELAEYRRTIFPVLRKGMDFLRDNPAETGCASCRFMEELESDGRPSPRSFGFAWFLTLGDLELWSKFHPTHLAIYNVFSAFAKRRGPDLGLELWHEVAVIPPGGGVFEYVNCHADTGLLGFFSQTNMG